MNFCSKNAQVYYIPVGLTSLQKDLIEILLCMHAESFLEEFEPNEAVMQSEKQIKAEKESEAMEGLGLGPLTPTQMNTMLLRHLRAVANHPCLLVDHYMPRKFLLMEPGEELIAMSEKFRVLNQIMEAILSRRRRQRPLQMVLVSHSVKELDLIEGFMLGKMVKIKRLSGTSLFDEKHQYTDRSTGAADSNGTLTSGSTLKDTSPASVEGKLSSGEAGAGYTVGGIKDDYDYQNSRRHTRTADDEVERQCDNEDWLFLATTTHLTHCTDLFDQYDIDVVLSFDPLLDESLPALRSVRKQTKPVPLVKLFVQDSAEHFMLTRGISAEREEEHLYDAVGYFIKNRGVHRERMSMTPAALTEMITMLLENCESPTDLTGTKLTDTPSELSIVEALSQRIMLLKLNHTPYELPLQSGAFNMKSYQLKLKQLIYARLEACQREQECKRAYILDRRMQETANLNRLDDVNAEAGRMFQSLKDEEKLVVDSERRLERTRDEHERLREKSALLRRRKAELEELLASSDLDSRITSKRARLAGLQQQLIPLEQENAAIADSNEELRTRYQTRSSHAANLSSLLVSLRERKAALTKESTGPVTCWMAASATEEHDRLELELNELAQQRQFLQKYIDTMKSQYAITNLDELNRTQHNKSGTATSRVRTTRATSPTYI
ncbi:AaceriAAL069Cp [[Ashbya] aceris (nom. inval.)]|nr:AaceriAAL069Cp [[Ashbya] aceris (nom. inval.)]